MTRIRPDGDAALLARPEFQHDLINQAPRRLRFPLCYLLAAGDGVNFRPDLCSRLGQGGGFVAGDRRVRQLCGVSYLVTAHFELTDGTEEAGRHAAMFERKLRHGGSVYLGGRAYPATVKAATPPVVDRDAISAAPRDLGWLMHSIDHAGTRRPRFFRASSQDNVIEVATPASGLLFG